MSYSTDSFFQEDTCTFPVYQRLRKLNPYAYYSLDAQKQMQQDLREAGSLVFFEQDGDTLPEPDEAVGLISLPDALSEADQLIETGDSGFVNAGPKLHRTPERKCTIWLDLAGVKLRQLVGFRFVHGPARRSAPTKQRSCAGLWSNRGAVFALQALRDCRLC